MYVLTNIEVEATHKVLKNLGAQIDNTLPEGERRTIRELVKGLGLAIDNGLPADGQVDNSLPSTAKPDNSPPAPQPAPKA
jgi:hypothetical protein